MAVTNPPGFLQNAGDTHTAAQLRTYLAGLTAGTYSGATLLRARGGVHPALGQEFNVTQTGSPSMGVLVESGVASIPGTLGATQGNYLVCNDAQVSLSVTAAHATLPRIDLVVINVRDSFYSGVDDDSQLQVVAGTPNSSPVAPTAPDNSLTVAQIAVGAAVTTIVNANITDTRIYMAATGGVINCRSDATRPTSSEIAEGQLVYTMDNNKLYLHTGSGTYVQLYPNTILFARKTSNETVNNSAVLQNDNELAVPVVANIVYKMFLRLIVNTGTTPDFKMLFTFPAGLTMSLHNTESTIPLSVPYDQTVTAAMSGTGSDMIILVEGIVLVSSTAGTLQLQWAQNTQTVSDTIVKINSSLLLIPVA